MEDVSCIDNDGDGFGQNCWAGRDCNDQDPRETCNHLSPCEQNPHAKGCPCTDGETHDCGEVTKRSAGFVTCGVGSATCSGGVWSDCSINSERTSQLSMQRFLALGAGTTCGSPCDPNCTLYNDIPDLSILRADAGHADPAGKFNFNDGGMSIGPADGGIVVGPKPDGAPPPTITPQIPAELAATKVACTGSVEAGATLTCDVTIVNSGGGWAAAFTNDLRLSADTTIDGTDVLLEYCGVSSLAAPGTVVVTCSGTIPSGTTPGSYQVGVVVDSGGTVTESNETNNTASTAVTVVAATIPPPPTVTPADLQVTNLTCTPTVYPGGTVSCAVEVTNFGQAWAGTFEDGLGLSTTPAITGSTNWLKDCPISYVAGGGKATLTCSTTLPASTTPGTYYMAFNADDDQLIPESDDTNNGRTAAITVVAAPSPLPDLIVNTVSCTPTSVPAGAWVSCDVAVANQGQTYAASSTLDIRISTSSTVLGTISLGTCTLPGILAGGSTTVTCPGLVPTAAIGSYYYQAFADSLNVVAESNNGNNWKASAVSTVTAPMGRRADLVVDSLVCFVPPASPTIDRGGLLTCKFNIRNVGASTATGFASSIKLSPNSDGTSPIALTGMTCPATTLAAGTSTPSPITCTGTVPTSVADGFYYLIATADSGNTITESSETNNTASTSVSVPTFTHNIVLNPGDVSAAIAAPNGFFTGFNCGIGAFTGFSIVDEDDSTDFDGPAAIPQLTAQNCDEGSNGVCNGQTWTGGNGCGFLSAGKCNAVFINRLQGSFGSTPKVTYQVPSTFPRGCTDQIFRFYVEAFIGCDLPATITIPGDPTKCTAVPGSTTTRPDIVVNSVSCGSNPVTPGATLTCNLTVANTGPVDTVAFTSQITTTIPSMAAMTCQLPNGLPANKQQNIQCTGIVPVGATAGVFNITGTADTGGAVVETDETNNSKTTTGAITVGTVSTPPPTADIAVTSVVCATSVNFGDTLACTVGIQNTGAAVGAFSTDFRLSTNATIDGGDFLLGDCDVANLAGNSSVTVSCTGELMDGSIVPGTWYAGVIADSGGAIAESNETNNTMSAQFTVTTAPPAPGTGPTNIVITSISCPDVVQGDTLVCDVQFSNVGGGVAGTFDDELRLSSDATIDSTDTLLGNCGVSALGVGSFVKLKCAGMVPASTATGGWYAGIIADSTGAVTEGVAGETDNTASVKVTVNAAATAPGVPAEIVIDSVDCPDDVNPGDAFSCTVVVSNRGAIGAPAFTNELRLSVDKTIDTSDTLLGTCAAPAIAAGANATITCSGTLPATANPGLYMFAGVIADSTNSVPEGDETNNTSYDPFLVPSPASSFTASWYERDYDASTLCSKDKSPVWSLFDWESSTPSDSSIAFFVQTASTKADLAAAVSAPLAVAARATASTPPGFGGGIYPGIPGVDDTQQNSVVVNDVLIAENLPQHSSWLRIRMNFAPSTNGQARPRLGRWGMQVSCQPSR